MRKLVILLAAGLLLLGLFISAQTAWAYFGGAGQTDLLADGGCGDPGAAACTDREASSSAGGNLVIPAGVPDGQLTDRESHQPSNNVVTSVPAASDR